MQNKHWFFGGLVVVLGLGVAACGASDGSTHGRNDAVGAGGVHTLPNQELVGTWRTNAEPRDYSEWLELRGDGTASFTRRRDDAAHARAWVAEYQCEWSVSGPAEASTLVYDCHRVSEAGSTNRNVVDLGSHFVDRRSVVVVGPASVALAPARWSAASPLDVYERYVPAP